MRFPFIFTMVDNGTGYIGDEELVKMNILYGEQLVEICRSHWDGRKRICMNGGIEEAFLKD